MMPALFRPDSVELTEPVCRRPDRVPGTCGVFVAVPKDPVVAVVFELGIELCNEPGTEFRRHSSFGRFLDESLGVVTTSIGSRQTKDERQE